MCVVRGDLEEPVAQKILVFPYLHLTREYRVITASAAFFSQVTTPQNLYGSFVLNQKLCIAVLEVGLMLAL